MIILFNIAQYYCTPISNLPDDTANKRIVSCYIDPTSPGYIRV